MNLSDPSQNPRLESLPYLDQCPDDCGRKREILRVGLVTVLIDSSGVGESSLIHRRVGGACPPTFKVSDSDSKERPSKRGARAFLRLRAGGSSTGRAGVSFTWGRPTSVSKLRSQTLPSWPWVAGFGASFSEPKRWR